MLKRLERFMRYKKYSVVVYMFLLVMITFMMTMNKGLKSQKTEDRKITLPAKNKQFIEPLLKSKESKKVADFFS